MELKDFIKETLLQISEGVKSAQEELKDSDCLINPMGNKVGDNNFYIKDGVQNNYRQIQIIKMSVAVSVVENKDKKSGIGIAASIFKADTSKGESEQNHTTNRIDFEIPISLPVSKMV